MNPALSSGILAAIILTLYVIPQLQLEGMWVEIVLRAEVLLAVFAHVVSQKNNGNNERDTGLMIILDYFQKLLLFIGSEICLEISHDVTEYIGVFFHRGKELKPFYEAALIVREEA